jgi:hypothetical protein
MENKMRLANYHRDAFVKAVMDDVPEKDFQKELEVVAQKELEKILPKEIFKIWKDNKLKGYLVTRSLGVHPLHFSAPLSYEERRSFDQNPSIRKVVQAAQKQKEKREELRFKVRSAIYSVSTVKKAKELLPGFAQYLPEEKDAPSKFAPAVIANLASDLNAAGWPKKTKDKSR